MSKILLVLILAAAPTLALAKEQKKAPVVKSCAAYGEGFKWVESARSCVKIGGYVRFEAGRSR